MTRWARIDMARRWAHQRLPRWTLWLAASIGIALIALPLSLFITAALTALPPELTSKLPEQSVRIEDREGNLLREVRTTSFALSRWVPLASMPKLLPDALVAVEDRRFWSHHGVDPRALMRAMGQAIQHRKIISGGSTLTMQLARRLRPRPRNVWGKFFEMALALRIEWTISKERILEEYLNRVDFGPNVQGISAASQAYFDKPLSALSLAEISLLVGLPQGPSAYALARHPARAMKRRDRVLSAMIREQVISPGQASMARSEPLRLETRRPAFGAPHFVSALIGGRFSEVQPGLGPLGGGHVSRVRTTLDPAFQRAAEVTLAGVTGLHSHHVTQAAALVVDNASGDVLAYVGSADYYDATHQGQVDGVRALRQPGSTLKPFVYAAAFEELGYQPATVIPDLELRIPTQGGFYVPRNFDDKFRGPVRLREALGNSLNIPAVHTAVALGPDTLLRWLHAFGFASLKQPAAYYGPALALGDGEVTLLELVQAYATLARNGIHVPLRVVSAVEAPRRSDQQTSSPGTSGSNVLEHFEPGPAHPVLSNTTASLITDILKDPLARVSAFGLNSPLEFEFDVAAKTGTSKGYRDNWVIGYSRRVTVGVWVGNFDGSPMRQVSGISGAGPFFHAIVQAVMGEAPREKLPVDVDQATMVNEAVSLARVEICPYSGQARGPDCPRGILEWIPRHDSLPTCQWHRAVDIDRRNGLLASESCPSSVTVREPFEFFPPQYQEWATSAGHRPAPREYSPYCPGETSNEDSSAAVGLRIVSPMHGSRFVIDPERPLELQTLEIVVVADRGLSRVSLEIDGTRTPERESPFTFRWQLTPGHHVLTAVAAGGQRSETVELDVR